MTLPLETPSTASANSSPLETIRRRRRWSIEEAARRSGLGAEEIAWLEEGRLYRFATSDDALAAAVVYASALGIGLAEARELAGLPPPEREPARGRIRRIAVLAALAVSIAGLAAAIAFTGAGHHRNGAAASQHVSTLAPPWKVRVDVLNGAGDINWTRQVASRIGALGYRLGPADRANRVDYPRPALFYEPRGPALAGRP